MNKIQQFFLNLIVVPFLKKKGQEVFVENSKNWYQSKTIWTGVVTILIAVYQVVVPLLASSFGIVLPAIPEWLFVILGALGIYARKTATTVIK